MTPQERLEQVKHWMELKQAWERWKDDHPMPPLSMEARSYFEGLSGRAVGEFVRRNPGLFNRTAAPPSDAECWAILMAYLMYMRPVVKRYLLDDIFSTALAKAQEDSGPGAGSVQIFELALGYLKNQFFTRVVNEAMRDYCRGVGVRRGGPDVISINEPVGESGIERGDLINLEPDDRWWETEAEREEVLGLGEAAGQEYFARIRPAFRLSLAMRSLRQSRIVTIPCNDPRVLAVAGLGTAVFADGVRQCLEALLAAMRAIPALAELDQPAFLAAASAAYLAVNAGAEEWFFSGAWIADCCLEQQQTLRRKDSPPPLDFCLNFHPKAETLALLVEYRLKEKDKFLTENEMARVFSILAGPPFCA